MATVRITGGEHRGRRVQLPKHHELRPTSDKARQAYFNIIGPRVEGATFLDLFAGTGIFSFEALSRGAARAVAIDKSRSAAEQITATAELIGVRVDVICDDVFKALKRLGSSPFDLVYADPPYDFPRYDELVEKIGTHVPLAAEAVVAVEHRSARTPAAAGVLRKTRTAEYGSVAFTLFEKEGAS